METLPRLVEPALTERLRAMPAVVVTGARQTGKSTLAAERVPGARRYATLDDLDVLDAARRGPGASSPPARPTCTFTSRAPDIRPVSSRILQAFSGTSHLRRLV